MCPKEACLDVVSLESPGDQANEAVVETSAERGGERSVRAGGIGIHVAGAKQRFAEWTKASNRYGDTRTKQNVPHIDVGIKCPSAVGDGRRGMHLLENSVSRSDR